MIDGAVLVRGQWLISAATAAETSDPRERALLRFVFAACEGIDYDQSIEAGYAVSVNPELVPLDPCELPAAYRARGIFAHGHHKLAVLGNAVDIMDGATRWTDLLDQMTRITNHARFASATSSGTPTVPHG